MHSYKAHYTFKRIVFTILAVSVILGCSDESKVVAPTASESPSIGMKLNFAQSDTDGVTRVEIVVSGPDMITVKRELNIQGGVISGTIPDVSVGPDRTFTLYGYDDNGVLIIQGSNTVDIGEGEAIQVNIVITRVGPIVQESKWISLPKVDPTSPPGEQIEFMRIPAGYFDMGSESGDANERPIHKVYLDEYYIGKYEITVGQFYQFLQALPDTLTPEYGFFDNSGQIYRHPERWIYNNEAFDYNSDGLQGMKYPEHIPLNNTRWATAYRFCEWMGGRLPTEAEWEKAAKGTDMRVFPWGNSYTEGQAAIRTDLNRRGSQPDTEQNPDVTGKYLGDVSPYGVYHMGGSVSEWTQDIYDAAYYYASPSENPQGPTGERTALNTFYTIRGGNYFQDYFLARTTTRFTLPTSDSDWRRVVGFRCVTD